MKVIDIKLEDLINSNTLNIIIKNGENRAVLLREGDNKWAMLLGFLNDKSFIRVTDDERNRDVINLLKIHNIKHKYLEIQPNLAYEFNSLIMCFDSSDEIITLSYDSKDSFAIHIDNPINKDSLFIGTLNVLTKRVLLKTEYIDFIKARDFIKSLNIHLKEVSDDTTD